MSCLRIPAKCDQIARTSLGHSSRRVNRIAMRSAETKQDAASTSAGSGPSQASDKPTFMREFTSYGARIVESDGRLTGPEDEKDFWEGEQMETVGRVFERFFLPGLVVLGLICGGIAARTYNDEADVFIAPPTGPEAEVVFVPAEALAPAPAAAPAPVAAPQ